MTLKAALRTFAWPCAIVTASILPLAAHAESNISSGGGTVSAQARVGFRVEIPRFVFLQVGTGTLMAQNTTQDVIVFQPAVSVLGTGSIVNATPGSGNLGNGIVTVRIISNAGNITFRATSSPAQLTSGSNTIPWTQIQTIVTNNATHPTINGGNVTFNAVNGAVNIDGTWTYRYLNAATPASGDYSSLVTYTASNP